MSDIFGADDAKPKRRPGRTANEELPSRALSPASPADQGVPADEHAERAERIGEEAARISDHAHRNAEQARIAREHATIRHQSEALNRKFEQAFGVSTPVGEDKSADAGKAQRARLRDLVEKCIPTYRGGPMRFEDMRPILLAIVDAL